jgi:hypothetical protein
MPDRFEREIDEILKKIDDFPQGSALRRRQHSRKQRQAGSGGLQRAVTLLARVSGQQIMLISLGLIVFSYLFRFALEGLWVYGLMLGLILFFTAFALGLKSNSGRSSEPYFRGRPRSAYQPSGPALSERLRRWWQQRNRRG